MVKQTNEIWEIKENIDLLFKASQINTSLIWMAATMSVIAAINSIDGAGVFYKALIFMIVGLLSLLIYQKRFKA